MEAIQPSNPDYDYVTELRLSFERQEEDDFMHLFSSSPMSSLTASPTSSRSTSPTPERGYAAEELAPAHANTVLVSVQPPPLLLRPVDTTIPTRTRPLNNQEQKKKEQSKIRKRNQRMLEKAEASEKAVGLIRNDERQSSIKKHIVSAEQLDLAFSRIPIVRTGYICLPQQGNKTTYRLDQLVGPESKFKFKLVRWSGQKAIPIADTKQPHRVMGLLGGTPDDGNWPAVIADAAKAIEEARPRLTLGKDDVKHRRGNFPAMAFGISHGGGQPTPRVLTQVEGNYAVFDELVANKALYRISGFVNGLFKAWQPRLYDYYDDHLNRLLQHDTDLKRTWANSVFAATSINFGPRTVCFRHTDPSNLPFGWCGITALGNYDYTRGGHVVLWKERLVVEFPPGSTIFLNSAATQHSNAAIGKHETRYSITQYTSGGIFRWVDFGFKKAKDYMKELGKEGGEDKLEELSHQLTFGLSLISTLIELKGRLVVPTPTLGHSSISL